jgi:NADH:ubiquinone oxidoreductase subunit H
LFCSIAKTTKIAGAVEDLYLIAGRTENFKKTHAVTKMVYLCAARILEINALMKLQPVPFRPGVKYDDIKINIIFSIH